MIPLKFVHAADLHLDSPFSGLRSIDPGIAETMQQATFTAFERLIDLCLREEVDFLLVAGDVYDSADRSLLAQFRFRKGLQRLAEAGIPSFVVHGNHDPLDGWSAHLDWPDSVSIFPGEEVQALPFIKEGREAARIWGISYPTREVRENLSLLFQREEEVPFAIGLLHCNLGTNTGHEPYAPCSLSDLERAGFDYWALGHVHKRAVHKLGDKALAVYPGNTQGRHPGESGPRGAMLVSVDSAGRIEADFIPLDILRWETVAVDISPVTGEEELLRLLDDTIAGMLQSGQEHQVCLRLVLEGRGELHSFLQRGNVLSDLETSLKEQWAEHRPLVWLESLEDRTRPAIDIQRRRRSDDFVAVLLNEFQALRRNLPREREAVLQTLSPLYQHSRRARKILAEPDEELLQELIDRAETICLDLLAGEEED